MAKWKIDITDFLGGYCPAYWLSDFPSYGNKNMAGKMQNIDLTNPNYLTQGPGLSTLTNGDQSTAVLTLIKGIQRFVPSVDTVFGGGGNKLYKITPDSVVSDADFPHTVDHPTHTNEDVQDAAYYHGDIYYIYNDNVGGDIGKLILPNTFDDDWGSTVPTGHTSLQGDVPRPLLAAGNDTLYFGNSHYVGEWNNSVFTAQSLDLPTNCVVQDLAWNLNRLFIAVNRPNVSGDNKNIASIYVWNGNDPSWEDEIVVQGEISALRVKNNVLYAFWRDISGKSRLGILDGMVLKDVALWEGSLPNHYQITEYKNFILWISDGKIYAWGSIEPSLSPMFFQLADGGYSTIGGLSAPFGIPLVASTDNTNYKLAKFDNYDINSYWYSLLSSVWTDEQNESNFIDKILINFETLTAGARCDVKLNMDEGTSDWTGIISYTGDGAVRQKKFTPNRKCKNFRIEFDFTNGSATNPVKIRNAIIYGHTV